jgi:1-acyl-sn-glycerol-3-phosphate acyltransferase
MFIALIFGHVQDFRFFLKNAHKFVPLAGWLCYFHDMIFLKRDYSKDANIIQEHLDSFKKHDNSIWLLLYPEV